MFGKHFPKVKPKWLRNSRGKLMELDGFCSDIKLAFEYHGEQHYRHVPYFHKTIEKFFQRQEDDRLKEILCVKHGVVLLVIPYTVVPEDMPAFISAALADREFPFHHKSPHMISVANYVLPDRLREMYDLARKKGGLCVSSKYVNNSTPIRWRCSIGHEWNASPASIRRGSWCPGCIGHLPPDESLEVLKTLALERGGECLSAEYVHGKEKLRWRCNFGHVWEAAANNVKSGSWCPSCARKTQGPKRLGLQLCHEAAAAAGGKCLSTEYVNSDTKMSWECDKGHVWDAIAYSVVRLGTWCRHCKGERIWNTRRANAVNPV
jgi:hypothetical protein